MPSAPDPLRARLKRLGLHGLLGRLEEVQDEPWLETLLEIEESERQKRSLERRLRRSKIGRFKPIADFDWGWPKKVDRDQIEEILDLGFLGEAANVVLMGPNGVGKTTLARNIGYAALLRGHTVLCVTTSEMLNDLAAQDSSIALQRRLRRYVRPALLVIDEVGYLSYDSRHGDLLFEVVSRRHEHRSIVLTTNKAFSEWSQVFPNSSSVAVLVDRLVQRADIVKIEGDSYRAKDGRERAERKAKERAKRRKSGTEQQEP